MNCSIRRSVTDCLSLSEKNTMTKQWKKMEICVSNKDVQFFFPFFVVTTAMDSIPSVLTFFSDMPSLAASNPHFEKKNTLKGPRTRRMQFWHPCPKIFTQNPAFLIQLRKVFWVNIKISFFFQTSKCFPGRIGCVSANPAKKLAIKIQIHLSEEILVSNFFSNICFAKSSFGQVECNFDSHVAHFFTKSTKRFTQTVNSLWFTCIREFDSNRICLMCLNPQSPKLPRTFIKMTYLSLQTRASPVCKHDVFRQGLNRRLFSWSGLVHEERNDFDSCMAILMIRKIQKWPNFTKF